MQSRSVRQALSRCVDRYFVECLEVRSLLSVSAGVEIGTPAPHSLVIDNGSSETVYTVLPPGPIKRTEGEPTPPGGGHNLGVSGYQIVIHFPDATLSPSQQAIFNAAADRWESVILGEISDISLNWGEGTQTVDDIHIDATAPFIDGVGNILGQAGPDFIRASNDLTINGIMQFDSADVADLQADGELDEVILHEMGHVLGLGTLWGPFERNLILNPGTSNPRYTGALATAQYQAIFGVATTTVPVENTGGAGTADGHWREGGGAGVAFDRELMTGFLDSGVVNPLSRISLAQFADLGYPSVNVNAFDVFNPTNGGNAYPTIASLSDLPDPAPTNSFVTLTANSVADTGDGTINAVRFYRETNNIPGLQILVGTPGDISGDLLLGSDTTSVDGYTFNASTTGLANGTYTYYAQATDNQNLVSVDVSTTHTVAVVVQSATPGTPDLVAATDTGTSNTDNITNRDNSAAAKNLQFSVTGTVVGALVRIYSGGTLIGGQIASGATTTVTTDGLIDLADGLRSITARQLEVAKTESADSGSLGVTIDTVAPSLTAAPTFNFETRIALTYPFNEPMNATFTNTTVGLQNLDTLAAGPSGVVSFVSNDVTVSYSGLPDANWRATIPNTFTDAAGNLFAGNTFNFFYLLADANRDKKVNALDFNALATNFGGASKTFSQGNFNYDTNVNNQDFTLLVQQFAKVLAAPPVPGAVPLAASIFANSRIDSDQIDALDGIL